MAYDKEEILNKCLKAIEEHGCTSFSEMTLYIEPARQTLYTWEMDKEDRIKEAIEKQKVIAKSKMKRNWQSPDAAPVLQLAAFKLMADEDEFNRLATNKQDVKADVKGGVSINIIPQDGCEAINED